MLLAPLICELLLARKLASQLLLHQPVLVLPARGLSACLCREPLRRVRIRAQLNAACFIGCVGRP